MRRLVCVWLGVSVAWFRPVNRWLFYSLIKPMYKLMTNVTRSININVYWQPIVHSTFSQVCITKWQVMEISHKRWQRSRLRSQCDRLLQSVACLQGVKCHTVLPKYSICNPFITSHCIQHWATFRLINTKFVLFLLNCLDYYCSPFWLFWILFCVFKVKNILKISIFYSF